MHIILEGPDNAGKSTLAEELRKRLGLSIVPHGPPYSHYSSMTANAERMILTHIPSIQDRIPLISELVYGPVLRNVDVWEGSSWGLLDALMRGRSLIIYCRPPKHELLNFGSYGRSMIYAPDQDYGPQAHKIIEQYDAIIERLMETYTHIYRYDYTGSLPNTTTLDYITAICKDSLKRHEGQRGEIERLTEWGQKNIQIHRSAL